MLNLKKTAIIIFTIILIFSCSTTQSEDTQIEETPVRPQNAEQSRQTELDAWARSAPEELKLSTADLADYLMEPCRTDLELARMIFVWISENIAYDTESFFSGSFKSQDTDSVIQNGTAVCAGYSGVYKTIADHAGLEAVIINGHGKGWGYRRTEPVSQNHAWTGVKIDGRIILIDSTWGSGYVDNSRNFVKRFEDRWFDVDPEIFIFSHFPNDKSRQLTAHEYSEEEYSNLPNLYPHVFTEKITPEFVHSTARYFKPDTIENELKVISDLLEQGITNEQITDELSSSGFSGFPAVYSPPEGTTLKIHSIPLSSTLTTGKNYIFKYAVENSRLNAFIYADEWHFALKKGEPPLNFAGKYDGKIDSDGNIRFEITPKQKGPIHFVVQNIQDDSFKYLFSYEVD